MFLKTRHLHGQGVKPGPEERKVIGAVVIGDGGGHLARLLVAGADGGAWQRRLTRIDYLTFNRGPELLRGDPARGGEPQRSTQQDATRYPHFPPLNDLCPPRVGGSPAEVTFIQ